MRLRLVVQNHVQQRAVNFQTAAVVVDEPQPSKFIHEKADAGPCRADHLRKRLLADLCDDRLGPASLPKFAKSSSSRARRFSLELNS